MNENSYLSPANIKAQCDAAITKLENDNEATYAIEEKLSAFQEDTQVKSEAFDALKLQMEDYKTVLQTMRTANECDIKDFRFLKIAVGFQELNGGVILEKKRVQMSEKHFNEQKAETYRAKARKAKTATLRFNYNTKVVHYEAMAELEQKLYDAWQEKENQYNGIESLTSGLFTEGTAIRATIENALDNITHAFYDGTYHPDMNAGWRLEIHDIYYNRVFQVSESGELTIDMEEVTKILKKDAGKITSAEYDVLALAYLMADEEELAVFMQGMMGERTDYDYTWLEEQMGYIANNSKKDFSEWKVDSEKMAQIGKRVAGYAEGTLQLLQKYRTEGDDMGVLACGLQRNSILQRMTLLNVVKQIGAFRGEYESDYPTITVQKNENGELILGILENKNIGSAMSPSYTTLGKSTVVIGRTINGASVDNKERDYSQYMLTNYFGNYSFANEAGSFVIDEGKGQLIGNAFERLSQKVAEKTGEEVLGKVVGYVPIVGDVMEFYVDTTTSREQAEENVRFIERQYESCCVADIYSEFDCCVNFVDFDLQENNSHVFYPYVGNTTDDKISLINRYFGTVLSKHLTREMLLIHPQDVLEFRGKVVRDEKLDQMYNDLFTGMIKE